MVTLRVEWAVMTVANIYSSAIKRNYIGAPVRCLSIREEEASIRESFREARRVRR